MARRLARPQGGPRLVRGRAGPHGREDRTSRPRPPEEHSPADRLVDRHQLLIAGEWVAPVVQTSVDLVDPSTEEVITRAPVAAPADVDAAVAAGRRSSADPAGRVHWSLEQRADASDRLAGALEQRAEDVAALVSLGTGMPITGARALEGAFPRRGSATTPDWRTPRPRSRCAPGCSAVGSRCSSVRRGSVAGLGHWPRARSRMRDLHLVSGGRTPGVRHRLAARASSHDRRARAGSTGPDHP